MGGRKGIRPVKTEWWGAGMVICTARNRRRIGVGIPTPASDSNKLQIISIESYP